MPKICPLIVVVVAAAVFLAPATGRAGVYSDALSKCLVERTNDEDKILLARWIFTVISAHPSTTSLATINEAQKTETVRRTGVLVETLLADSCRDETAKAVKYEGTQALNSSFKVLGGIAMGTLMANPVVQAETANFIQYVDETKLEQALAPQAGG